MIQISGIFEVEQRLAGMRFLLVTYISFWIGVGASASDQATTNAIPIQDFKDLKIKAELGDADSEFGLGKYYYEGVGVTQDKAEGVRWLEKAADQGNVEAEMWVGINYWNGIDVKMDEVKGVEWFRKAADQAEPGAFHYLGAACYLGKGVKQDFVQSYKWTLLFKDSGRSVIPDNSASITAQLADLEKKMTAEQIVEGKGLAKEAETKLSKLPRFLEGK